MGLLLALVAEAGVRVGLLLGVGYFPPIPTQSPGSNDDTKRHNNSAEAWVVTADATKEVMLWGCRNKEGL